MKHLGTKTIETPRLILRRFTMDDAKAMFDNWASDPEVTKFLTWPAHGSVAITGMVLQDWTESYQRSDCYNWAITIKAQGTQPVGNISVVHCDDNVCAAEIGYCMGRNWWGGGIMTEALGAVIDYLFAEVGANRISARHDPRNPGSGRVMQKSGMTYEGTLRQIDRNNLGICDASYYSILAEEWQKK